MYRYHCNFCGNNDEAGELTLKRALENNGVACNTCSGMKVKEGINDIPTTSPWMIPYFQGGYDEAKQYSRCSHKKIHFICPDCGRVKQKSNKIKDLYYAHTISCSCSDGYSYPNKFMFSCLEQLGKEFIPEYMPEWIKPKRYDFYLPNENIIIEMDGGLGHGHKNTLSKNTPQESVQIDNFKDRLAFENGIAVVRIDSVVNDCNYVKKNIIDSCVFSSEELSVLDFNLCDKFAITNRAKEVCEFYEKNKPILTTEISSQLKISPSAVWTYLSKGNLFGWCSYDGKAEMKNNGVSRRKPVLVYDSEGNFIKRYTSAVDLCKASKQDFGVEFCHSPVTSVARNETSKYKNYIFKYE